MTPRRAILLTGVNGQVGWELHRSLSALGNVVGLTSRDLDLADVDNGDPCYLPDGRIIFNSTRMFIGVPCEDGQSYVSSLCLTDAAGSGTRILTFDQESSNHGLPGMPSRNSWDRPSASEVWPQHTLFEMKKIY